MGRAGEAVQDEGAVFAARRREGLGSLHHAAGRVHASRYGIAVPSYPFLSDQWIAEARKIREEFTGRAQTPPQDLKMNQVVTDVPFGEGTILAHVDSSSGNLEIEPGHIDEPDVTITLDYETARAVFVEGNPQAGMQAFMAGRIRVQGDMTKLITMQQTTPDPVAAELHQRIRDITA
jgi:hypothetical protein